MFIFLCMTMFGPQELLFYVWLLLWSILIHAIKSSDYTIPDKILILDIWMEAKQELKQLEFNLHTTTLEETVELFCLENHIQTQFCQAIYDGAVQLRYDYAEEEMLKYELSRNTSIINSQFIPNPHLLRTSAAASAELDNHFKDSALTMQLSDRLHEIKQQMISILRSVSSANPLSVIMIHSCSLKDEKSRVLLSLLNSIEQSGLLSFVDVIFVMNYGIPIPLSTFPASQQSKIQLLHVASDTSYFEVPTMILMNQISKNWVSVQPIHWLYLHTKGVSYKQLYPQIEDWREYMLYFLVNKYLTCYHLLASGAFDTVGVNFKTNPRDFRGNFWWATSDYLATVPPLDLHEADKYTAEKWMLSGERVRIYNFHESSVDHHKQLYGRQEYATTKDPSSESKPLSIDDVPDNAILYSAFCKGICLYFQN